MSASGCIETYLEMSKQVFGGAQGFTQREVESPGFGTDHQGHCQAQDQR